MRRLVAPAHFAISILPFQRAVVRRGISAERNKTDQPWNQRCRCAPRLRAPKTENLIKSGENRCGTNLAKENCRLRAQGTAAQDNKVEMPMKRTHKLHAALENIGAILGCGLSLQGRDVSENNKPER